VTDVIESPDDMRTRVFEERSDGRDVGFVPTMGSFHKGHRALMSSSLSDNDTTIVSLFVNPTQFDSDDSAEQYPRDVERDCEILEEENVDVLFKPAAEDIYPDGDVTKVLVENEVTESFEGKMKPRFFPGVARIVSKLLNIVPSHRVYFGGKDLQQLLMIRRMVLDLHYPQQLKVVPVVRDDAGVAFSSRNRRFRDTDWETACSMRQLMTQFKAQVKSLDRSDLDEYRNELRSIGLDLDYLDVVEYPSFDRVAPNHNLAVLVAAGHVGSVRVKDNLPLHAESIKMLDDRVRNSHSEKRSPKPT